MAVIRNAIRFADCDKTHFHEPHFRRAEAWEQEVFSMMIAEWIACTGSGIAR